MLMLWMLLFASMMCRRRGCAPAPCSSGIRFVVAEVVLVWNMLGAAQGLCPVLGGHVEDGHPGYGNAPAARLDWGRVPHVETVTDLFPGMYPAVESHRPATVGSRHSTTLNETMLRADAQASQAPY